MSLTELNKKLADFPYVNGYTPSQGDVSQLARLPAKYDEFTHVARWAKHMASFSETEKNAFPGTPAAAASASKKAGDDDDDIDLFGSDDDEEAEKAKVERAKQMEAQKKKGKPSAKSSIVLDVKVYDDETDLKEIEALVRKIQKDGLLWGAAKSVPLAYGVCKLQIVCIVEDDKVSVDWLTEQIEDLDLVQSTDIAAFQKI